MGIYLSLVVERQVTCLHREAVARVSKFLMTLEGIVQKCGFGDRDGRSLLLRNEYQGDEKPAS